MAHTLRTLCGMLGSMAASRLMLKYDLRKYLTLSCLFLAGTATLNALATQFWHIVICYILTGFSAGLCIYTITPLVVNQWFTAGAVGLMLTGSGTVLLTGVFVFLLGGGRALGVVEGPILVREAFGRRSYTKIFSTLYSALFIGSSLTAMIYGFVYDSTGSYTVVFLFILGCILLVGFTVFLSLYLMRRSPWRMELEQKQAAQK